MEYNDHGMTNWNAKIGPCVDVVCEAAAVECTPFSLADFSCVLWWISFFQWVSEHLCV